MTQKYVRFVTPKEANIDKTQDVAELVALDANGKPVTIGGAASLPVAKNVSKAAGDAPTKQEFDALVDSLVAAGLMAAK
ncbi:hypothetical protein [Bifidobacterium adolescentis]|uniref:hypothetical protein n=1 Tax=Bifidobacterium adolescentis TaxID=1680 RepID=UPI003BB5E05E